MEQKFVKNVKVEISYHSENPVGFSYESHLSNADIHWVGVFEFKADRIKNICFITPNQLITLYIELQNDQTEETKVFLFKVKLSGIDTDDDSICFPDEISPQSIDLELTNVNMIDDRTFEAEAKVGTLVF
jgi:hypothetical protein